MDATIRSATPAATSTSGTRAATPARTLAVRQPERDTPAGAAPVSTAPLKRGLAHFDTQLQGEVARAQQALECLDRVSRQLETLKGELAAKLAGSRSARQLEAQIRQLSATLETRRQQAGGGIDAQLEFNDGEPATQRFRIRDLSIDALQASAPQTLAFSVGGLGGPQLTAAIEPGMTAEEIAHRLDRALAPAKVRAALDGQGQLVFSTLETDWPTIKDGIAVSGRGRVDTEETAPALAPQGWEIGNPDALRQSLREVVQALARVRRAQDAASATLSAAMARVAQPDLPLDELAVVAQDFSATAASHDYQSLLEITSALVGVSRERVLALLGLR